MLVTEEKVMALFLASSVSILGIVSSQASSLQHAPVFNLLCAAVQVTKEKVMALLQAADMTAQLQALKAK